MKSLNRSLPTSNQPSEELLRAFKTAAISVTSLYREAASGQSQARAAGYQDALDDLLAFLDQRSLGLGDGEGWLVRQWATGRLEARPANQGHQDHQEQHAVSESEDEKEQDKEKSPSPAQPESSPLRTTTRLEVSNIGDSTKQQEIGKVTIPIPSTTVFTFESSHAYPKDIDMQNQEVTSQVTVKPDSSPRITRQSHKKSNNKPPYRSVSAKILGLGSGSKRRLPYGEFFDISGIGEGKDSSRTSAKRAKMGQ